MIVERIANLNIKNRNFITAIKGNIDDSFVDENLCSYTFEQQLYIYLKREGYDRVFFYNRAAKYNWFSFDKESINSLFPDNHNTIPQDGRPLGSRRLRINTEMNSNQGFTKEGEALNHRKYYYVSNFQDSTLATTVQDILRCDTMKSVIYFSSSVFSPNNIQGFVDGIAQTMNEVSAAQSANKLLIQFVSSGVFKSDFFSNLIKSPENVFSIDLPDRKECQNWLNLVRIKGQIDTNKVFRFPFDKLVDQIYYQHKRITELNNEIKQKKDAFVDSLYIEDFSEQLLSRYLSTIHGQQDIMGYLVQEVTTWVNHPDEHKTPLVLMFAGTSGTGKTYTAEKISEALKGQGYQFVKLNMNEYKGEGDAWKLLGSPTGYIGSGNDTPLVAAHKKSDKLIILFDEMEKAHPSLFETIMTLMEKGELTNGKGEKMDFRKSIIIFTTNLAMNSLIKRKKELQKNGEIEYFQYQQSIKEILKQNGVKTEICGRINSVYVYNSLDRPDVIRIAIEEIRKLGLVYNLQINNIPEKLLKEIADQATNSSEGARPIQIIVKNILDRVFQSKSKKL